MWSDRFFSYYNGFTFIFSTGISVVATMSILVFAYFSPYPFLVHLSISWMFHPILSIYLFHSLYFWLFISVLMSMYAIYGFRYASFRLHMSLFILFHFSLPFPLSACIPDSIHLCLFSLIIMFVTCF